MLLSDNTNATTGDLLDLDGGMYGIVLIDFDENTAVDESLKKAWRHIERGLLVYCKEIGIVHYLNADPDIRLLSVTTGDSSD